MSDELKLPDGSIGEFFITNVMLDNMPDLKLFEKASELIQQRSFELGISMTLTTKQLPNGILITWRPTLDIYPHRVVIVHPNDQNKLS